MKILIKIFSKHDQGFFRVKVNLILDFRQMYSSTQNLQSLKLCEDIK